MCTSDWCWALDDSSTFWWWSGFMDPDSKTLCALRNYLTDLYAIYTSGWYWIMYYSSNLFYGDPDSDYGSPCQKLLGGFFYDRQKIYVKKRLTISFENWSVVFIGWMWVRGVAICRVKGFASVMPMFYLWLFYLHSIRIAPIQNSIPNQSLVSSGYHDTAKFWALNKV